MCGRKLCLRTAPLQESSPSWCSTATSARVLTTAPLSRERVSYVYVLVSTERYLHCRYFSRRQSLARSFVARHSTAAKVPSRALPTDGVCLLWVPRLSLYNSNFLPCHSYYRLNVPYYIVGIFHNNCLPCTCFPLLLSNFSITYLTPAPMTVQSIAWLVMLSSVVDFAMAFAPNT